MKCPKHPEVWLYSDRMEKTGLCTICQKSYPLVEEAVKHGSDELLRHYEGVLAGLVVAREAIKDELEFVKIQIAHTKTQKQAPTNKTLVK